LSKGLAFRGAKRRGICFSALFPLAACWSGASGGPATRQGATLASIRARGAVKCGITQGAGFATPDDSGHWRGFDVDFCRALAVALFNDPNKVQFVPFTQQQRFSGLQSGEGGRRVTGSPMTRTRALERAVPVGSGPFYAGR